MKKFFSRLSGSVRAGLLALAFVLKDARTPLSAKIVSAAAAAYLIMPFELLPDFAIPFGFIDDLIAVPLMLYYAYSVIPKDVLADAEVRAGRITANFKKVLIAAVLMFIIFASAVLAACYYLIKFLLTVTGVL